MRPNGSEAKHSLLQGHPNDGVQVRLGRCVQIALETPVSLELNVPRKFSRCLMTYLRHFLQCPALLGALGHPEVNHHGNLPAALSALLLAVTHTDHLSPKGGVGVLWHLDLLWWAASAVLAVGCIGVCAATAAEHKPLELEPLAGCALHQLLRRQGHQHLDSVAAHLLLQLRLHGLSVHLGLLLLDLLLESPALWVVLGHLVELRIHLGSLTLQFLEGRLHVSHKLNAPQVVVPLAVRIAEDLVSITDFIERFHVATFVWMVLHGQTSVFAFDLSQVGTLLELKNLVKIRRDHFLLIGNVHSLKVQLWVLPTLRRFLPNKLDFSELDFVLVIQLLPIRGIKANQLELDDLERRSVDQDAILVCRPKASSLLLAFLQG
mmetsp:Transcript_5971/g.14199  ORF Transcript_5971/g.14199 Transcript_5971/m.14199 type:complete len:377 (-) Transcript_5971:370-1500(-)